jgi:histidyl-tRNA synthetase
MQLAFRLRKAGIQTEIDLAARSMKAQMREANRTGSAYALFVGQSEFESGVYALKNLQTSEQTSLDLDAIIEVLREPAARDSQRS